LKRTRPFKLEISPVEALTVASAGVELKSKILTPASDDMVIAAAVVQASPLNE